MIPHVNHSFRLRFATLLATLFVFCSCQQTMVEDADNAQLVDVNVSLTNLDVLQTRATATEAKVTNITFKAIDADEKVQETITQTSDDEDFATLSMKLPVGTYTFVAIANTKNATATISSSTEASINSAQNITVYSATKSVTISGNTTQSVTMEMGKRKNSTFNLKMTDPTPDDVAKMQIQVSPTSTAATTLDFNPGTGLAFETKSYGFTLLKSAVSQGTYQNITMSVFFLLTSAQQKLDVKINALSSTDEVLYTRTLKDVTFKQSESTTATGTFFSSSTSGSFTFDTSVTNTDISLD